MDIADLFSLISEDLQKVEDSIFQNLDSDIKLIPTICSHILGSGGKRLRPALLLLSCKLFNYTGEERIPLSVAVEYIHTATLLHDDVVDNSTLRRGKKSANSIWGNEASVLVGDFLFAKAFILMVGCKNLDILHLLSNATGDLAQGEIFELVKTGDINTSIDEYFKIIDKKTAVLFSAACEIGAILGQQSIEVRKKLNSFGKNIGIAFQLVDDALDYISTNKELGKKIGTDMEEGKVTLPLISALKNSTIKEEYERAKEIFFKDNHTEQEIDFLKNFVINNRGIEETIESANNYINKAKASLSGFKHSKIKTNLLNLADFIVKRRF
jgi:octaprenyl-diphosphate synthase